MIFLHSRRWTGKFGWEIQAGKFVLWLFFRTWEENLWRFHWSKNVWSDFIHVVEAWTVRVVIFTSDVEKNQRRHVCHHLRQKRLQRIHQSPAHRKLFISLRIIFLRKMTKSSLLETRRIVEYDVIASEFPNLFSRSDRIFCDEIRSKLINLFFRTSSMYGSEYQWFELKKLDQYWWKLKTLNSIQ